MVTLFASVLAAGALAAPSPQPRMLVAGPALAGGRVVWGEQREGLSVLRAWPDASPLWQSSSSWFAGSLAGSSTVVAFSRSYDGCPGRPGVVCPVETQTMAGPRGAPFAACDVQAEGSLAVVHGWAPGGRAPLAWRGRGGPALRRLQFRIVIPPRGPDASLVGVRIVAGAAAPRRSSSQLVVA